MDGVKPKDFIFALFKSLGAAYQALQCADSKMQVMEIFPLGTKGHVVFYAEESLTSFYEELGRRFRDDLEELIHIPHCPGEVLQAYLSLENAAPQEGLLIAESPYVGPLMIMASQGLSRGLRIMDLRMLRGASSASYLFLTGVGPALSAFAKDNIDPVIRVSVVEKMNPQMRDLFEIQPQSP